MARGGPDPARDPDAAEDLPPALGPVVTGPAPEENFDTRRLQVIVEQIEALRWR